LQEIEARHQHWHGTHGPHPPEGGPPP
jgi:hypothetical protein